MPVSNSCILSERPQSQHGMAGDAPSIVRARPVITGWLIPPTCDSHM